MCCRTDSFCCTHNIKKGIIIAGVIDILLLIVLITVNILLIRNWLSIWFVAVIIADVLLIIGSKKSISGLLMAWMVVGMINIVLLFIGWIGWTAYGIIAVFVSAVCNTDFQQISFDIQNFNDPNQNFDISSINSQFDSQTLNDPNQNFGLFPTNSQSNDQSNPTLDCQGADKYLVGTFVCNAIFVFGLPIYYIYLWVVVKSHRENLMEPKSNNIYPMHQPRV